MHLIVAASRTITDALMRVTLALAALAALAAPATAQPTSLADTVSISVEDGLRYVIRGEVHRRECDRDAEGGFGLYREPWAKPISRLAANP